MKTSNASPIHCTWIHAIVFALFAGCAAAPIAANDDDKSNKFRDHVAPLIDSSCIDCHDSGSETGLDFTQLGNDLGDAKTFKTWEKIFDRVRLGEMPPQEELRPEQKLVDSALDSVREALTHQSRTIQVKSGRTSARRLTKREFGNTLRDLLQIESDIETGIPNEVESGSFDTVGSTQRISAIHLEGYLDAIDRALNEAIQLGRNPYQKPRGQIILLTFMRDWHDKPIEEGGGISRILDDEAGVALFRDVDYLTAFAKPYRRGRYNIIADLAAYQSATPVTAKILVKGRSGSARLIKSIDLDPDGKTETVSVEAFLEAGDMPYVTLVTPEPFLGLTLSGGSKNYRGRGLAIYRQQIEGPLVDRWPPESTRQLLQGIEIRSKTDSDVGPFEYELSKPPVEHLREILSDLAAKAFRRPVDEAELKPFIDVAKPAIKSGRPFDEALRVSVRAMLTSPQFLLFSEDRKMPNEPLDGYAIANRLSYFLWKSMPDEELIRAAKNDQLTDDSELRLQVDRMLDHPKSKRFIDDFVGQWLRLYKLNLTSPDENLYPEFDELLLQAISQETELFFQELVRKNLGLSNLVDSEFTFLNRRLAEHYKIDGVMGQDFRRVSIPDTSPRGGVLTQAAILKTTANGTTTSPVMRGNFVLTNLLGTPPSPPPPAVGSIEPDTRGKTTIREILAAHRNMDSCATCHRKIDPPGFALESFDPIGGFRKHYRSSNGIEKQQSLFTIFRTFKRGPRVDASGVTADGEPFSDIDEFKHLLMQQKEQIARHFVSQLVVYSTGAEIQFADREIIESILQKTSTDDFPVRDIIHEVIQSRLFRHK